MDDLAGFVAMVVLWISAGVIWLKGGVGTPDVND